jgi:hypothetical protein
MRSNDGQEIKILLENSNSCCEVWGAYIYSSLDFEAKEDTQYDTQYDTQSNDPNQLNQLNQLLVRLLESNVTSVIENSHREQHKNHESGYRGYDGGGYVCVDIITDRETFHIDLTNDHNGYYRHNVYLKWKDFEDDSICI